MKRHLQRTCNPALGPGHHARWHLLLAVLAIAGIGTAVLTDFPLRSSAAAASDLKTLYAAAWCFRHGLDAYSFTDLQRVFQAQGMPSPRSWYAHAPVYPPATLALLAPLTLLPMASACWVEAVVSLALMALAVAEVLRHAEDVYGLPLLWRAGIAGVCAAGPLLAFAVSVGNLSVAASALAILAFLGRTKSPIWISAALLGLSLSLKPHVALWVVAGLLLLREQRGQQVALAGALLAAVLGIVLTFSFGEGEAFRQSVGFVGMVRAELAPTGSMFAGSREALPVVAQIPALNSMLGFWTTASIVQVGGWAVLLGSLAVLGRATRRVRDEPGADLAIAAWCAFGLLITYHRAHDAIILLLLTPWLADRLRRQPVSWRPWAIVLLYGAISLGPAPGPAAGPGVVWQEGVLPRTLPAFFLSRQAALAALGLCATLLLSLSAAVQPLRGSLRRTGWIAAGPRLETGED